MSKRNSRELVSGAVIALQVIPELETSYQFQFNQRDPLKRWFAVKTLGN
jgi:hypothetical protein